ncbi:sulfite exporter TauE/SafE family protein [Endozoicomonas ascidiicola]|uniref:sulfite exporter TauE/SafE family protein n=1 Tax=Endozoicomonas ascidiicola TaxID=1698521 RepID=UPI0008372C6F|nr:sulfite exporter TauE/SafE family protein [Endozoicomonas ascidiicola]
MTILLYLLLGASAGLTAGLFGVGGGLIIVPALIYSFKLQGFAPEVLTHMAVGTSLAAMIVTSLSSIKAHQEEHAVQWKLFSIVSAGILVGAFLGAYTAVNLSGHFLQTLFGIFAIGVSAKMWFGFKVREGGRFPGKPLLVIAGVVIGGISSMFGIGGGTLSVPFLRRIGLTMQKAVATSAACGLPIAVMGSVSNMILGMGNQQLPDMTTGYVYWPAFIGIVVTSVFLARLGARLAHNLPADKLQKLFAILLVVVGVQLVI